MACEDFVRAREARPLLGERECAREREREPRPLARPLALAVAARAPGVANVAGVGALGQAPHLVLVELVGALHPRGLVGIEGLDEPQLTNEERVIGLGRVRAYDADG